MTGNLWLAFGVGMLATVSPCGIAMLPAFLAYYIGTDEAASGGVGRTATLRRTVGGLSTGAIVSVGFISIFVTTAILVTSGLKSVTDAIPWIAVVVGIALMAAGLAMAVGRRLAFSLDSSKLTREGRGPTSMLAYGAAYGVASLSCGLGAMLAVIGTALRTSSASELVGVYTAFALGSAVILMLLSLSAAVASDSLIRILDRSSRYIPTIAGVIVFLSGIYMVAYWGPAALGGKRNGTLMNAVMPTTGKLHEFFKANTGALAVVAVGAIVAVLVYAYLHRDALHADADDDARDDTFVN